jgi:glycopeptide antibiotics resistance protein/acyl carrier protein
MRVLNWGVLLIAVGVIGMLVSAFADSIGVGHYHGFGMEQFTGLVIGALVTATGMVKVLFADTRILARVLTGIYVGGILYLGLTPSSFKATHSKILLSFGSFGWHDFAINMAGFILLGYLFMLSFGIRRTNQNDGSLMKRALVVAGAGGLISLFLEVSQYYLISGRYSSLTDWIANTLGTLVGIAMYIIMEQENAPGTRMKGLWRSLNIAETRTSYEKLHDVWLAKSEGMVMTAKQIESQVRDFILEQFLFNTENGNLSNDVSFLETGIVDSTGILELLAFLEKTYGITIEYEGSALDIGQKYSN